MTLVEYTELPGGERVAKVDGACVHYGRYGIGADDLCPHMLAVLASTALLNLTAGGCCDSGSMWLECKECGVMIKSVSHFGSTAACMACEKGLVRPDLLSWGPRVRVRRAEVEDAGGGHEA
jgi:hypothetical protein